MSERTLFVGASTRLNFLTSVRVSLETADGCERLYDDARSIAVGLVRSQRPQEEVRAWAESFLRVAALAREVIPDSIERETIVIRFETLHHLLCDEGMYQENYSTEQTLKLLFCEQLLGWLHHAGRVTIETMVKQLDIPEPLIRRAIQSLSQHRLVDWSEHPGPLTVWLTEKGDVAAAQL